MELVPKATRVLTWYANAFCHSLAQQIWSVCMIACMQAAMHALLSALGQPQNQWPVVHIAGTKGKGSTGTFLSAILTRSQLCTGLYTRSDWLC